MVNLLRIRKILKRKKPEFKRLYWYKKIGIRDSGWRRPRGIDNKVRRKWRGKPKPVDIGYRAPKKVRGLLPNGKKPVLVHNLEELMKIDKEKEVAIISSTVGKKKREEIIKKASELGIEIWNI